MQLFSVVSSNLIGQSISGSVGNGEEMCERSLESPYTNPRPHALTAQQQLVGFQAENFQTL